MPARDFSPRGVEAGASNGGEHAAEESDEEGTEQRVDGTAPVDAYFLHARQISREHSEQLRRSGREQDSDRSAACREDRRFGEQLRRYGKARSTQREANGDLLISLDRPREQERCNIRAGD